MTTIAGVLDRLVLLFGEASDLQILDGPHIGEVIDDAICVGFTDGPDSPGYTTERARQEGMGRPRILEVITVRSLLSVRRGETDAVAVSELRASAAGILSNIDEQLRDEVTRTGVWHRAGLTGDTEWIPVQDSQGAVLDVFFDVVVSVLL